ncbi:MAG: hypothetical protein PHO26_09085 [Dehalococcoidia bacterium]|nr:hypothetical protein [Dehalococcoidia bacterium]MDD5493267.1 hypothetical protein [Dehalococcoidia bacterium]
MACFLVPMGEAIVTTIVQKIVENTEKKASGSKTNPAGAKWSQRLGWLNKMLWGGVMLLALEHMWHGEIVPWPPFLTAMQNPADIAPMLQEVATIGTGMAIFVTLVWVVMVIVAEAKTKTMPQVKAKPAAGGA